MPFIAYLLTLVLVPLLAIAGVVFTFTLLLFAGKGSPRLVSIIQEITVIVIYPPVAGMIAFVVSKFHKNSNSSVMVSAIHQQTNDLLWEPSSKVKTVALAGLLTIIGLFIFPVDSAAFKLFGKNEFKLTNCEDCQKGKCKKDVAWKGFTVLDSTIQIFVTRSDGIDKIISLPQTNDVKCVIAKNKNYAFSCESNTSSEYWSSNFLVSFNGERKFVWENQFTANNVVETQGMLTCNVN